MLKQPKITAPIPLMAGGGTPKIRKPPVSAPALEAMYYGVPMRQDVATAREPSARELLAEKLQAQFERFMPQESAKKGARKITGYTYPMGVADITPAGIPLWAYEGGESLGKAAQAAGEGEYGTAALEGLMGALGVAPAAPAIGALGKAAGKGVAGQIERAMMAGEGPLGSALAAVRPQFATAYHGSPHRFEKFDISKIGTGEGAQAYGHGLYFAESPEVAQSYRQSTSGAASKAVNASFREDPSLWVAGQLHSGIQPEDIKEGVKALGYQGDVDRLIEDGISRLHKVLDAGALYKVDIPDEAVARMLDWDKPLSEQSKKIQNAAKTLLSDEFAAAKTTTPEWGELGEPYDPMQMSGAEFMGTLTTKFGRETQNPILGSSKASVYLRQQGIPGIKYLDEGSRAAGEGTRNFVLFSDELPRILEVNEQPTGALPWRTGEWKTKQER